jgi:ribosomal protein S18 acetylase RimI-like enzyme
MSDVATGQVVVEAGPDDWRRWRDLRLEALADTPLGYCEALTDARRRDEASWRAALSRPGLALLVASGGEDVAMGGGFVGRGDDVLPGPGDEQVVTVFGVYVRPAARGRGLLEVLVERVAAWGREQGCTLLALDVHEDNGRALAAYARLRLTPDGRDRAYGLDPERRLRGMSRPLAG